MAFFPDHPIQYSLSDVTVIKCKLNSLIVIGKEDHTLDHLECWWGAHLPFCSSEPVGG